MGQRELVAVAVTKLADVHGRALKAGAIEHWITRLLPFSERPVFWRVMTDACDGPRMPSLTDVVEEINHASARQLQQQKIELPQRNTRSDHAAVMSMLWLVYVKKWAPSQFEGSLFKRLFDREGTDAATFIRGAMEAYDEQTVRTWMESQILAGN